MLVNRHDLRANREPNATTVQKPNFLFKKICVCNFSINSFLFDRHFVRRHGRRPFLKSDTTDIFCALL